MSKRAVIYARVSTDEQAENFSLPTQIKGCREYAARHGFTVVKEFTDDCSGAIPIIDRPIGRELYELIDSRAIDAVIIFTLDRISRGRRGVEYILFKDKLFSHGIELHFTDAGIDTDNFEGDLVGYIKALIAAEERMRIRERTMRGRLAKAQSNQPVMSGYPPYGYRRIGKRGDARLVIDEEEAFIVRNIFEWYVIRDGPNGPLSLRAIAARLEEMQAPTPHYRSKSAKRWTPTTVHGILTNELYAGRTYYGKTRIINERRIKQPPEQWIPIDVPELTIIEAGIFEAVQERARKNRELARRNQKREYLLSGHFRCGVCSHVMGGISTHVRGREHTFYKCGHQWEVLKKLRCPNQRKTVITEKADSAVWNWLADLLRDDQAIIEGIRDMRERSEAETEPKQRRFEQIDGLIDSRRRAIDRLVSELGDEENEAIIEAVKMRIKALGKEVESLTSERDSLAAELTQVQVSPELEAEVLRIAAEIREELDAPDFETKRYLLDKLNVQAVFQANDSGRWLDVKCGIIPDWESIMLHPF